MAAVTSPETSPQPRVYFQTPAGTTEEPETPVRKQGRVTVKYDRKELRKRLNLEEWIIDQLTDLYDCEEEAIPELEIDVDELLDMPSDVERAARVKVGQRTGWFDTRGAQARSPRALIQPVLDVSFLHHI
uniref:Protein phosphatase 1, regulatory (inhibitor) subunit 14Bb n=1 Tax=Hippocampus comes TaxID=109280 RepID=A0A3Q2YAY8_HIPCM